MKYLFSFIVILSVFGCASVSEYNQGCRDGIGAIHVNGYSLIEKSKNEFCNALDEEHRAKEKLERQGNTR